MNIPRPEFPRPQLVRDTWMNLNGKWDFLFDFGNSGCARGLMNGDVFDSGDVREITVPFCPESRLSGIGYGTDVILKSRKNSSAGAFCFISARWITAVSYG